MPAPWSGACGGLGRAAAGRCPQRSRAGCSSDEGDPATGRGQVRRGADPHVLPPEPTAPGADAARWPACAGSVRPARTTRGASWTCGCAWTSSCTRRRGPPSWPEPRASCLAGATWRSARTCPGGQPRMLSRPYVVLHPGTDADARRWPRSWRGQHVGPPQPTRVARGGHRRTAGAGADPLRRGQGGRWIWAAPRTFPSSRRCCAPPRPSWSRTPVRPTSPPPWARRWSRCSHPPSPVRRWGPHGVPHGDPRRSGRPLRGQPCP